MVANAIYVVHDAKLQQIFYIANDLSKKMQYIFILQCGDCNREKYGTSGRLTAFSSAHFLSQVPHRGVLITIFLRMSDIRCKFAA
jgi:hypothetical protein